MAFIRVKSDYEPGILFINPQIDLSERNFKQMVGIHLGEKDGFEHCSETPK